MALRAVVFRTSHTRVCKEQKVPLNSTTHKSPTPKTGRVHVPRENLLSPESRTVEQSTRRRVGEVTCTALALHAAGQVAASDRLPQRLVHPENVR